MGERMHARSLEEPPSSPERRAFLPRSTDGSYPQGEKSKAGY